MSRHIAWLAAKQYCESCLQQQCVTLQIRTDVTERPRVAYAIK